MHPYTHNEAFTIVLIALKSYYGECSLIGTSDSHSSDFLIRVAFFPIVQKVSSNLVYAIQ